MGRKSPWDAIYATAMFLHPYRWCVVIAVAVLAFLLVWAKTVTYESFPMLWDVVMEFATIVLFPILGALVMSVFLVGRR